jgi:IclR family KDG regulon transcriptional repressor
VATGEERTIKSARRVLEILEFFDREHPDATVMDMSRALSYPQSSTSELLRSLTRLGYLHYDRQRRTYSPTARVALLGAWVDPVLFRGGAVLEALDHVAALVGETVLLSSAANYTLHHLHVVPGAAETSVIEHAGHADSFLHSPQGRLIMSSYRETHIRSALHRLNADEPDPSRRVRVNETLEALLELRKQGHVVEPDVRGDGTGVVTILLPPHGRVERLTLSVIASSETIAARSDEILAIMQHEREHILPRVRQVAMPSQPRADMGPRFADVGEVRASSHEPESLVA